MTIREARANLRDLAQHGMILRSNVAALQAVFRALSRPTRLERDLAAEVRAKGEDEWTCDALARYERKRKGKR